MTLTRTFNELGHQTPINDQLALRLFGQMLSKRFDDIQIIEIGSYVGGTALTWSEYADKVFCIDTWQGSHNLGDNVSNLINTHGSLKVFRTFCENTREHLFKTIFPCVGPSSTYASIWPFQVDLVFIDADHSYEAVFNDIMNWKRHVKPGGILCGHDYDYFPGVTQAVDELLPHAQKAGDHVWWTEIKEK